MIAHALEKKLTHFVEVPFAGPVLPRASDATPRGSVSRALDSGAERPERGSTADQPTDAPGEGGGGCCLQLQAMFGRKKQQPAAAAPPPSQSFRKASFDTDEDVEEDDDHRGKGRSKATRAARYGSDDDDDDDDDNDDEDDNPRNGSKRGAPQEPAGGVRRTGSAPRCALLPRALLPPPAP